ncbi:hypothetical protein SIL04_26695 [Bacillus cereus group sp. BfR-BA-00331]|uniref:hypothetical protein n=1 Tax=Bacillus cereus group sp. BfR-BA-00331 TaxID=3094866 RepID=UPI0029C3C9B8|nr:hypothetical protein [Bacillus cereus group sp. BfR-BA-00331]MDX5961087.1 hypothetical protein [Bacillus cereus group sp. BfR-BA-00331]
MRLYILEIHFAQKISFLHARTITEAIKRFQRIYTQYAEQVPSHIREVHANETVILDIRTGEVHCIGDNNMLRKCIDNLMHLNAPIEWIPLLEIHQSVKPDLFSITIHKACLIKGSPQYSEVGITFWESILQVSLYDHREFWNALKRFLHIQVLSVSELEQLIKNKL